MKQRPKPSGRKAAFLSRSALVSTTLGACDQKWAAHLPELIPAFSELSFVLAQSHPAPCPGTQMLHPVLSQSQPCQVLWKGEYEQVKNKPHQAMSNSPMQGGAGEVCMRTQVHVLAGQQVLHRPLQHGHISAFSMRWWDRSRGGRCSHRVPHSREPLDWVCKQLPCGPGRRGCYHHSTRYFPSHILCQHAVKPMVPVVHFSKCLLCHFLSLNICTSCKTASKLRPFLFFFLLSFFFFAKWQVG